MILNSKPNIFRQILICALTLGLNANEVKAQELNYGQGGRAGSNSGSAQGGGSGLSANGVAQPAIKTFTPGSAQELFSQDRLQEKAEVAATESLRESSSVYLIGQEYATPVGSVFLRGVKSEQSLLLWNGLRVLDSANPTGSADPLDMNREFADQIRILKGPQTLIYGSSAIGGVIEVSKAAHQDSFLQVQSDVQGFNKVQIEKQLENFRVGSTFLDSENYSVARGGTEKDLHRKFSFSAAYDSPEPSGLKVITSFLRNHIDDDQPPADDPNSRSDWTQGLVGVEYKIAHEDNTQSFVDFQASIGDRDNRNEADSSSSNYYTSQTRSYFYKTQVRHQKNYSNGSHWVVFGGADFDDVQIMSEDNYNTWGGFNKRRAETNAGGMWQGAYGLFQPSVGVRADCFSECEGSFQLTVEHHLRIGTLYAMAGQGVKKASIYQLYDPTYGNANLKDEVGTQYELGWLHHFGDINWDFAGFWYKFKDLQQFANGVSGTRYYNIGEAYSRGLEVSASVMGLENEVKLSAAYTEAVDALTFAELLRVPKYRAHARWDRILGPKLSTVFEGDYVGGRPDYNVSRVQVVPEYFLLHTSLRYKSSGLNEFFLRVNNLLNQSYTEIWNYSTPGRVLIFGYQAKI